MALLTIDLIEKQQEECYNNNNIQKTYNVVCFKEKEANNCNQISSQVKYSPSKEKLTFSWQRIKYDECY